MTGASVEPEHLLKVLKDTVLALVGRDRLDIAPRQLAVLLTCYLKEGPHTVRGLAAELNLPKPSVSRALDALDDLDFTRRIVDPADRRSVLVERTMTGLVFLQNIGKRSE